MLTKYLLAIVTVFLLALFLVCSVAAYQGYGVRQVGPYHVRAGSVQGPSVLGGGPSTGK